MCLVLKASLADRQWRQRIFREVRRGAGVFVFRKIEVKMFYISDLFSFNTAFGSFWILLDVWSLV